MRAKYSSFKYGQFEKYLDDVLGADRNGDCDANAVVSFDDPRVCKYSLAGCCPYKLLMHTRMEQGPCKYEVCPAPQHLRELYLESRKGISTSYDVELFEVLDRIISAADKRIRYSKSRKESSSSDLQSHPDLVAMDKQIKALLEESRRLGMAGDVIRAQATLNQMEILKEQRAARESDLMKLTPDKSQKSHICEVCSAVIEQSDLEGRMADHVNGRQHNAYSKMREVYDQLKSLGIVSKRAFSTSRQNSSRVSFSKPVF